jgi:hypothetical protein
LTDAEIIDLMNDTISVIDLTGSEQGDIIDLTGLDDIEFEGFDGVELETEMELHGSRVIPDSVCVAVYRDGAILTDSTMEDLQYMDELRYHFRSAEIALRQEEKQMLATKMFDRMRKEVGQYDTVGKWFCLNFESELIRIRNDE